MPLLISTQSFNLEEMTDFGLLFEMDENTGEVLRSRRIETPAKRIGEERVKPGLRGISIYGGEIYVAAWGGIHVLDAETLEPSRIISHKWMSDLHGILVDDDGIWVTSSLPDAMILFDLGGVPRAAFWAPETFLYSKRAEVDKDIDWSQRGKGFRGFNDFHANHVELRGDSVYVTGRSIKNGRVVRFDRAKFIHDGVVRDSDIELFARQLHGPHDGIWADDGFYVTETMGSTVALMNESGKVINRFHVIAGDSEKDPRGISRLRWFRHTLANLIKRRPTLRMTSHWTRGLAISPEHLYVGQSTWAGKESSRARVAKISRDSGKVIDTFYIEAEDYPETRIFQIVRTG